MTSKKRRQRGSRTHGSGTHKNRRGAGNRGGRGRAGRDKHQFHKYDPVGKQGFTRPPKTKREVRTVELRDLDENAPLYAVDGLAEETDDGYRIDARDIVEDGYDADAVKVLGGGQVHRSLVVVADGFSGSAEELLAEAGGKAMVSERGRTRADVEATEDDASNEGTIQDGS